MTSMAAYRRDSETLLIEGRLGESHRVICINTFDKPQDRRFVDAVHLQEMQPVSQPQKLLPPERNVCT